MSEMQFYVSVAVMPTVTIIVVLIGVLLNNNTLNARLSDLRSEMNARFQGIDGRFEQMNGRFADFYDRLGDVRDTLRAEMSKNHSEMLSKFAELDLRLSRLEAGPAEGWEIRLPAWGLRARL